MVWRHFFRLLGTSAYFSIAVTFSLKHIGWILVGLAALGGGCTQLQPDVLPLHQISMRPIHMETAPNTAGSVVIADSFIVDAPSYLLSFTNPKSGTLTYESATHTLTYRPNSTFLGADTASYQICVGGSCQQAAIYLQVSTPCNPIARNDLFIVNSLAPSLETKINCLRNDDTCGGRVSLALVLAPRMGQIVRYTGRSYYYQPNPGATGTDSLQYELRTSAGVSRATVYVVIPPPLQPCPQLFRPRNDTLFSSLLASRVISFTKLMLLANDLACSQDLDYNTFFVPALPLGGYIQLPTNPNDSLRYFPNATFTGIDSVTYSIGVFSQPGLRKQATVYFVVP
jgi:hypothetical protein